jgi:hypothetical protein
MLSPGSSAARFFSAALMCSLSASVSPVSLDLLNMMLLPLPLPAWKRVWPCEPLLLLLAVLEALLLSLLLPVLVAAAVSLPAALISARLMRRSCTAVCVLARLSTVLVTAESLLLILPLLLLLPPLLLLKLLSMMLSVLLLLLPLPGWKLLSTRPEKSCTTSL